MRNAILAMILALALVTGELHAAAPKTPPADVGPGRVAWFDITTTNLPRSKELYGIGAVAVVVDPAGHPVGLYSRTPLAPAPSQH